MIPSSKKRKIDKISDNSLTIISTSERQGHGKAFENWFIKTFVEKCNPSGHTDKWDVKAPTYKTTYSVQTAAFNALPVSIKTCRYGGSVNFGDAIRQFENGQDFLLVVAFYRYSGKSKQVVHVLARKISHSSWSDLFLDTSGEGSLLERRLNSDKYIRELDTLVKGKMVVNERKKEARKIKKKVKSIMTLNPKIHSDGRGRLQCSINNTKFRKLFDLGKSVPIQYPCKLWGVTVPDIG